MVRRASIMRHPRSFSEQRLAHCRGELLRGCGIWPYLGTEHPLEPPFERFIWSGITKWDLQVNGFDAPYQGQFADRFRRLFTPAPVPSPELYDTSWTRQGSLQVVLVRHYTEDEVTSAIAEQLLLALGSAKDPIAFEIFGIGKSSYPNSGQPRIETRFAVSKVDTPLLEAQLHNLYPRSAVEPRTYGFSQAGLEWKARLCGESCQEDLLWIAPLYLAAPYCFAIRNFPKLANDPLSTAVAVMDELRGDEWALIQVLFCRAKHSWAENLRLACEDPYRSQHFLIPDLDQRLFNEKLSAPLYAASIILAANTPRALAGLGSWVHQYQGTHNRLAIRDEAAWARQWPDNRFPDLTYWRKAIGAREPLVPGMIFNASELASIVHLPSPGIPSERLLRVTTQTRQPPKPVLEAPLVVIGQNVHRGQIHQVAIPPEIRARHCYIAGASGTGKSTLLLNLILQDIAAGHGAGLLDPHGDLVKAVLRRIPETRIDDVVLFDAADKEYPFALNILEAHNEEERQRIVAETLMALERYFPASWGPRLEHILRYTLLTVLHAVSGATLADVELMLTDVEYRNAVLEKTTDLDLRRFWTHQFKHYPGNASDPVLNKLSRFLLNHHVRNIVCQRRAAINFDWLLNDGKILLVNLSAGQLTEKVAGVLGSFLVTKIISAAFRRGKLPESERRPWYLFVDEFQNFMDLSIGFEQILAEARKYRLVLAGLANQYVGQLSQGVRQAIFGNVGSFIVFRLGVEDAQAAAKELDVFTATDILNLEVGQAIARVGGSSMSFNLRTFREPPAPTQDPTQSVIALARQRYARPRNEVEAELREVMRTAERQEAVGDMEAEQTDPSEDDLVT
jgi:hypothetical protein